MAAVSKALVHLRCVKICMPVLRVCVCVCVCVSECVCVCVCVFKSKVCFSFRFATINLQHIAYRLQPLSSAFEPHTDYSHCHHIQTTVIVISLNHIQTTAISTCIWTTYRLQPFQPTTALNTDHSHCHLGLVSIYMDVNYSITHN